MISRGCHFSGKRDTKQPVMAQCFISGTSPVTHWLRVCLSRGVQVQSLFRELRFHLPCCAGQKKKDPSKNKKDRCSISYYRPMYCEREVQMESVVARELSKSEPGGHQDKVLYARLNLEGLWPFDLMKSSRTSARNFYSLSTYQTLTLKK